MMLESYKRAKSEWHVGGDSEITFNAQIRENIGYFSLLWG
jgi:hypothetical protein